MKYRHQLVYGRKRVQSWQGLLASGPMEWGKGGKGWPEKATVRWSQLNVGGFLVDTKVVTIQCGDRYWLVWKTLQMMNEVVSITHCVLHKVHFYNMSSFKTLHGFPSKAG